MQHFQRKGSRAPIGGDCFASPTSERGLDHVIVFQKVVRAGQHYTLPVLYLIERLSDGQLQVHRVDSLIDFLIENSARSTTWKLRFAYVLGLLVDFTLAAKRSGKLRYSRLGPDFANALVHGTISKGAHIGSDALELYWHPKSRMLCRQLMASLMRLLTWQTNREGPRSWSNSFFVKNSDPVAAMQAAKHHLISKRLSLLSYIDTAIGGTPLFASAIIGRPIRSNVRVFRFPAKYIWPLLFTGFRSDNGNVDEASELVAFLQAIGGCRSSEPFHVWVQDVQFIDSRPNVFLHHPEDGVIIDGQGTKWSRNDYLLHRYARRPRNKLIKDREYAGWKGLDDEASGALLYWLPIAGMQEKLARLLLNYLQSTRPRIMERRRRRGLPDHPYLLVSDGEHSDDPNSIGAPFTMTAYLAAWERAIARLSSRYNDPELQVLKEKGTTTHGLRHHYGSFLVTIGIDGHVIKQCMHHRNSLSHLVYTALTSNEIHNILTEPSKSRNYREDNLEDIIKSMRHDFTKQRYY